MSPEAEKETRRKRIDKMLDELGWNEAADGAEPATGAYRRPEIETDSGPADYGLYLAGKLIGIVEAKKLSLAPQNVLSQAERYSEGAHGAKYAFGKYRVPFIYSSNGEVIWFRDVRHDLNRSRQISVFHAPAGLRELITRNPEAGQQWLKDTPSTDPRLRYYQHDAYHAIEEAIIDRKRRMLVAMATGTGKTFTLVNEIYRLLAFKTAKRVLFLVDLVMEALDRQLAQARGTKS